MKVSVLGTGRMGRGLVKVLSGGGAGRSEALMWGTRSIDKAAGLVRDNSYAGVRAVGYDEALSADIVFHAFWFRDVMPWAHEHRERLADKILVDIANPFTEDFSDFTLEWGVSAAEELQRALPRTKVVGAFKNTFFRVLEEPVHKGLRSDVYVTGDDEETKLQVVRLLQPTPFRVLDGGALRNNRTIERMTLFEREVALRYGAYPYVSFRLFGLDGV